MAIQPIPAESRPCKATAEAYWDAAAAAECMGIDAERLAETAFALSASELFSEAAQHAFHSLGLVAQHLQSTAKKNEDRFTKLSGKRGAAQ